jgi:hypothetical protein
MSVPFRDPLNEPGEQQVNIDEIPHLLVLDQRATSFEATNCAPRHPHTIYISHMGGFEGSAVEILNPIILVLFRLSLEL